MTILSTYTWSRSMDMGFGSVGNTYSSVPGGPQSVYNLAAEYGLSAQSTPHRLSMAMTYELPFGKGKAMLANNKLLDYAIGGWSANFVSVLQSEKLRWVQLTSAGYTRYDTADFRSWAKARGVIVTNSSSVYAEACAEHVFAFMLAQARLLLVDEPLSALDPTRAGLQRAPDRISYEVAPRSTSSSRSRASPSWSASINGVKASCWRAFGSAPASSSTFASS